MLLAPRRANFLFGETDSHNNKMPDTSKTDELNLYFDSHTPVTLLLVSCSVSHCVSGHILMFLS